METLPQQSWYYIY